VVVIGKGQSALESAALLHESGARVEIITRGDRLNFINLRIRKGLIGRMIAMPEIHQFLYPPTDLAGPPYNWAIADPALYRRLSKTEQAKLFQLVGPIGSKDLKSRLADVLVTTQVEVKKAYEQGQKICLNLSDGTQREVDHVFLATGYRPNINQCEILGKDLKAAIAQEEGYPLLTIKYESTTVKNLYVLGALACKSQGPINRFICGTYLVGQYLTEAITGSRIGYPNRKISRYIVGRSLFYRMHQIYSGSVLNKMRAGSQ
jgi:NADPH-dependent 2,4-dienoyl-CoA reductase/sulfur reductase-like enzyme